MHSAILYNYHQHPLLTFRYTLRTDTLQSTMKTYPPWREYVCHSCSARSLWK